MIGTILKRTKTRDWFEIFTYRVCNYGVPREIKESLCVGDHVLLRSKESPREYLFQEKYKYGQTKERRYK